MTAWVQSRHFDDLLPAPHRLPHSAHRVESGRAVDGNAKHGIVPSPARWCVRWGGPNWTSQIAV